MTRGFGHRCREETTRAIRLAGDYYCTSVTYMAQPEQEMTAAAQGGVVAFVIAVAVVFTVAFAVIFIIAFASTVTAAVVSVVVATVYVYVFVLVIAVAVFVGGVKM